MKICIAAVALIALLVVLAPSAFAVNGVLFEVNGIRALHVWGAPYDMGYAQGHYFKDEVLDILRIYTFPPPGTGTWLYDWARQFVLDTFAFSPETIQEAQGMYDGMIDAGVEPYVDVLGRAFDAQDILTYNGLADIVTLFCATLMAWNTTTAGIPDLQGAMVVAHNTDFIYEAEDPWLIADKSVIIAYSPQDPDKQRYVSVGSAGVLGVIAGMNESGIVTIVNQGLYPYTEVVLDPKPEMTIWMSREALSFWDFDGDEINSIDDFVEYYRGRAQFSATINQVLGPVDRSDPPALVLEINNVEKAIRYPDEDPQVFPDAMMALNWEDKLMPDRDPDPQERYDWGVELINEQYARNLSIENLWDFLANMQQPFESVATMQSMLFVPATLQIAISISGESGTAPEHPPVWLDFEDLFVTPLDATPGTATQPPPDDDDDDDDDDDAQDDDSPPNDESDSDDGDDGCSC